MATYRRYNMDIPLVLDKDGNPPQEFLELPTDEQGKSLAGMCWIDIFETALKVIITKCNNINAGMGFEEKIKATVHVCSHEEGLPCPEPDDLITDIINVKSGKEVDISTAIAVATATITAKPIGPVPIGPIKPGPIIIEDV